VKKLLLFLILPVFWACKKETKNSAAIIPDKFYFKGIVNGTFVNWSSDNLPDFRVGVMDQDVSLLSDDCINSFCKELQIGALIHTHLSVNGDASNSIQIFFTQAIKTTDETEIKSWFSPGLKTFGSNRIYLNDPIQDGIVINYADSRGWSSNIKWGDQNGSSFESVELKDATTDKSYQKIWKAKFSCKLYTTTCLPGATWEMITIADGEICVPVFLK
jgi:hypothetical protein